MSSPLSSSPSLLALREWDLTCAAVAAGRHSVLIRKGGIAEGSDGFTVAGTRFALLPTLFHQKHGTPQTTPYTVSVLCELLAAVEVPGSTDLSPLAPFHQYAPDQLATRLAYKPDRPLTLLAVRPFRLRTPIVIPVDTVRPVCASWLSLPIDPTALTTDPVPTPDASALLAHLAPLPHMEPRHAHA